MKSRFYTIRLPSLENVWANEQLSQTLNRKAQLPAGRGKWVGVLSFTQVSSEGNVISIGRTGLTSPSPDSS